MFDIRRDGHHIARVQFPCHLSFLLIPAPARGNKQNLPARMAVPVIAAARHKGPIADGAVPRVSTRDQHMQISLPYKIGGQLRRHLFSARKYTVIQSVHFQHSHPRQIGFCPLRPHCTAWSKLQVNTSHRFFAPDHKKPFRLMEGLWKALGIDPLILPSSAFAALAANTSFLRSRGRPPPVLRSAGGYAGRAGRH